MAVTAGMDIHPVYLRRLSGRLREQARSHSWIAVCQVDRRRLGGRHRRQASSHRRYLQPTDSALCCMNSEDAHPAQTTQSLRRNKPQSRVDGAHHKERSDTCPPDNSEQMCTFRVCVCVARELAPAGVRSAPIGGGCAAEREQAPSPQVTGLLNPAAAQFRL